MSELMRRIVSVNADISRPLQRKEIGQLLATGDENADRFVVFVSNAGNPVDLTGCTAKGYFIRPDKATVPIDGSIDTASSTVTIDLSKSCYVWGGCFTISIKIEREGETLTLCIYDGYLKQTVTGVYAGSEDAVVSLEYVLQKVAEMEALAGRAETAVYRTAPAITDTASGTVATFESPYARPALSVVSEFTSSQADTPSPDNVCPISRTKMELYRAAQYDETASPILTDKLPLDAYHGTLDWATGEVKLTTRLYIPTGDDVTNYGTASTGVPYVQLALPEKWSGSVAMCSHYPIVSGTPTKSAMRLVSPRACYIYDTRFVDRDTAVALIDTEKPKVVFGIEEPQTLKIKSEVVELMNGNNALWSGYGETSVEYVVDTKTYIDNAVANALTAIPVYEGEYENE